MALVDAPTGLVRRPMARDDPSLAFLTARIAITSLHPVARVSQASWSRVGREHPPRPRPRLCADDTDLTATRGAGVEVGVGVGVGVEVGDALDAHAPKQIRQLVGVLFLALEDALEQPPRRRVVF